MRPRAIDVYHSSTPLRKPLRSATYSLTSAETVLLRVATEAGDGLGYAHVFDPAHARSLAALVEGLARQLVGNDLPAPRDFWPVMRRQLNWVGPAGVAMLAMSVVDTALWDVHARAAQLPLFRLLGGGTTELSVYASGGWASYTGDELLEEARRYQAMGVRRYKIKVGAADWRQDARRIEALRSSLGDSMQLLVDANQAWSRETALAAGRAFEDLGVTWFEEPVAADDLEGAAALSRALSVPVAGGEGAYGANDFLRLIERKAADVLMPDLIHCGGPTGFLDVAILAAAHHVPISSHMFAEVSAHLMSAVAPSSLVEFSPDWLRNNLFEGAPRLVAGMLTLSERQGLGMTLTDEVAGAERTRVA